MNKLPIQLLLYVAIFGLLGGSGWHFYQAAVVERKNDDQRRQDQAANAKRFQATHERGAEGAGKIAVGPNYAEPADFWNALRDANFIGKEPPPPVIDDGQETKPVEPLEVPQTPLEDIFVLTVVAEAGQDSRVIIRYKPAANVEPPPEALPPAPAGAMDTVGAVGNRQRPALPTYGDGLGPAHILQLEDTLWKPYAHIRLVRTVPGGAIFVREDPEVAKEEWVEETIYPEVLELSQAVLKQLAEAGVSTAPNEARVDDPSADGGPVQQSGWQPFDETTEVDGRFNIGTRDSEVFRSNPERIFSEDVGTANWVSQRGTMRGVRITKLAPGYQRYGVQEGEIILAVNGEPVGSKTQALKVGKAQYKRGARTFEIEFLTPVGARITRTYVARDDG